MNKKQVANIINNYNGVFAKGYDISTRDEMLCINEEFDFPVVELKRQFFKDFAGNKALITYQIKK